MAIGLIQGPPNSGRLVALLERFQAALGREPVLVVPTGDDVATFERELCEGPEATLGATIVTFGGLTAEIGRTLALELGTPLSPTQRAALVRAAINRSAPRLLRRSAARPGFAPAADALIAELQAALVEPPEFAELASGLEGAGYERELAGIYSAYAELRDAGGRSDAGLAAARAVEALRVDSGAWGDRPVFAYGFDDLTRAQTELLAELAEVTDVTIAVTYDDRRALAARAGLLGRMVDELGAERRSPLPHDPEHTASATLRHLDRHLFEPGAPPIAPDEGLRLLDSAGARGEAESIAIEIARLLERGVAPDEIVIVLRHPDSAGPVLAAVLGELGVPVALEASAALPSTCVGTALIALCRAAADETDVAALLTHLRCDPSLPPAVADSVERRIRRGSAQTVGAAIEGWESPPRHLARLLERHDAAGRLRALARSARELAEGAHRERAPLATRRSNAPGTTPFSALELRAGVAAAELLAELADVGELPGADQPDLTDAIEALESTSVPRWRGPATGRVRIMSPYRARAARARVLFCAGLGDGEFPSAAPPDPLLSEERRRELGVPDLRRGDQADEERYLFFACVSRPTDRLYLSWQSCDEDGAARARSPFVDEVLDLVSGGDELIRVRGPERAVLRADESPTPRALARALALEGWSADRSGELDRLGVGSGARAETLALFEGLPDPALKPGPLRVPTVLGELASRGAVSANSLEGWVTCSYKWFVEHELAPLRLEPEADPLWLGGLVHRALELLYREAPGSDSIPRPGDVGRWKERFRELLQAEAVARADAALTPGRRSQLERARIQVDEYLDREAETDSEFRPLAELLEATFGEFDDIAGEEEIVSSAPGLRLGEVVLRGRIDRIDVAADCHSAIVRDYKTGKAVPSADKLAERGALQIQLYMLAVRRLLGLEPVAGLYQPLGAAKPSARVPRGLAAADDPRLDPLGLVGTDRKPPEVVDELLADAERRAVEAAAGMRAGRIARDPLNGECPRYCTFQSICRLERALGAVGDEASNGNGRS